MRFRLPAVLLIVASLASQALAQSSIDPSRYRAQRKAPYTLDENDVLGVFVEGVLGDLYSSPPVQQPPPGSKLPPAIGFPTMVLHDGTIRLPLIDPVPVRGLTVPQVEQLLKKLYRGGDEPISREGNRIIVTLMRQRTVSVTVIREDQSSARSNGQFQSRGAVANRSDRSGRIETLRLPAGDNDLLNALVQSGGLPGVNARDNIQIYRQGYPPASPAPGRVNLRGGVSSFPRAGQSRSASSLGGGRVDNVPLRSRSGQASFPRSQSRLNDGDIVQIRAKPTEVYYTGGQLRPGEFLIPRDRQLSILEAVSLAGGIPQNRGGIGVPQAPPGALTVHRRTAGGGQVSMRFDLGGGFSSVASRTPVRSGDLLILDFSRQERVRNIGTGVFNTFGLRQIFQ